MTDTAKRRIILPFSRAHLKPTPPMRAGWYPTADGQWQRWHDGTGWTRKVRRADAA